MVVYVYNGLTTTELISNTSSYVADMRSGAIKQKYVLQCLIGCIQLTTRGIKGDLHITHGQTYPERSWHLSSHLVVDEVPVEGVDHVRNRTECLDVDTHGHLQGGCP